MNEMFFDKNYLASLYSRDQEKRMAHIEILIDNEADYLATHSNELPRSMSVVKNPLQIQKDENILTLLTFAALHKGAPSVWEKLLSNLFKQEWDLTDTTYNLQLEKAISPTEEINSHLRKEARTHPVKYARLISEHDKAIEGPTNYDAVLTANEKNIFFECKFTSDISHDTTHCTNRNQIARCIDVGLASVDDRVEDFYFVLVTPSRYTKFPGDRLYYFKMNQYMNNPMSLALDIPRLHNWYESKEEHWKLEKLTKRISWLTWEDCIEVILNQGLLTDYEKTKLREFYEDRMLYRDLSDLP